MLIIRFRRIGKRNKPTYRVVVAEHTFPINGRFVTDLGAYNPHTKSTVLKKDEALEWLNKGAKPSNSVARLFEKEKIKHSSIVIIKKKRSPKKAADEAVKKNPVDQAPIADENTTETQAKDIPATGEPTSEIEPTDTQAEASPSAEASTEEPSTS
jgi:small subunit ribosomal protein S16